MISVVEKRLIYQSVVLHMYVHSRGARKYLISRILTNVAVVAR